MTTLLSEIAVLIIALIYTFLGYRLARILLPICGSMLGLALLIALAPDYVAFVRTDQMIVAVCSIVSLYVLLFMFKRAAALVSGLVAAAFVCLALSKVLHVTAHAIAYPIMLTVCVIAGLMCCVYRRIGVIVATSIIGGALAALFGMLLIDGGISATGVYDFVKQAADFFGSNAVIITVSAIVLAAAGIFFQLYVSGKKTILPSWKEKQQLYVRAGKEGRKSTNMYI